MEKQSQPLKKLKTIIVLLALLAGNFIYFCGGAVAAAGENSPYYIHLDKDTIARGYTVQAFAGNLKLSLTPGILDAATGVDVMEIDEEMPIPWNLSRLSKIYQFEFRNKAAYDDDRPFYIQFSYDQASADYKQVFFYDKNYSSWRPLPTKDYPREKFVRSLIHLPFARIAVLSHPNILTRGQASWYAYRGGNFAASPDFPPGSRLRVYNEDNDKFVDVEVNDYGPDRNLHPGRVLDLDKAAFRRIAALGDGLASVRVEPLYVAPDARGQILGIKATGATTQPDISVRAAIVMDEDSGEVLWEKDSSAALPLASLTKLVAIKVFLDTRPSLDLVVTYSVRDEEYNYEFCNKWESARVSLSDGDTLTVEDLIYSSLVGSANNTVETLVRVSGLERSAFIAAMNAAVADWGAEDTSFIEPTGLSPKNVSSARDYAIITKEVFKHPIIQKASIRPEYEFYIVNTKKRHLLRNTNQLIASNQYQITGSKTGYLDEAGYCLMTRFRAGGKQLIVVTMGAASRDISFAETEDLMRYGAAATRNP